jgi:hypothetical protein
MPLRQYFAWVGSILLVALFVADWCFPALVHAPRSEIPPHERVNLRIHSDHKWPEKVVFDTTRSPSTPVADTSLERDVVPGRRRPGRGPGLPWFGRVLSASAGW